MFLKAMPIWAKDREKDINLQVGFVCKLLNKGYTNCRLALTGSTLYRVYINGEFIHYGPARVAHGYSRVDELDITTLLTNGENIIAIEVAGYNCPSYYTINYKSFLRAEITSNDNVLACTGMNFEAFANLGREQAVMRYSFQRTFSEVWNIENNYNDWKKGIFDPCETSIIDVDLELITRAVPYPTYNYCQPLKLVEQGVISEKHTLEKKKELYSNNDANFLQFDNEKIKHKPFYDFQLMDFKKTSSINENYNPQYSINQGEYLLFDMGKNNNGFIKIDFDAIEDVELLLIFDETLINGILDCKNWGCLNIVKYIAKKSNISYKLQSFESYGFKYFACVVTKGSIIVNSLGLTEYSCPLYNNTAFECGDKQLQDIFDASIETYRQNTLDTFMDCPTRERAGWLCDSYFTGQSSQMFSGTDVYEKVFLENFVLREEFPHIPKGMLPMCYPADHLNGNFIPQWALWYIIELEGYFKRSIQADKNTFKQLCYNLISYFDSFVNSDGLLEKLDKWNFVEWSDANKWVLDVNYPTNMLFQKALSIVGILYDDKRLVERANKIKEKIIEQSFDGIFFIDNAERQPDGSLKITQNRSEVCQYYAFFFDVAHVEDDKYKELKKIILEKFGPKRKQEHLMPEIAYANAFIGNYLRIELLVRWGYLKKAAEECKGYFSKMASLTGTLWEHDSTTASMNHGFASYIGVVLVKCITGLIEINESDKSITISTKGLYPVNSNLKTKINHGYVEISSTVVNDDYKLSITIPPCYKIIEPT